jgi:hypothetical protein
MPFIEVTDRAGFNLTLSTEHIILFFTLKGTKLTRVFITVKIDDKSFIEVRQTYQELRQAIEDATKDK